MFDEICHLLIGKPASGSFDIKDADLEEMAERGTAFAANIHKGIKKCIEVHKDPNYRTDFLNWLMHETSLFGTDFENKLGKLIEVEDICYIDFCSDEVNKKRLIAYAGIADDFIDSVKGMKGPLIKTTADKGFWGHDINLSIGRLRSIKNRMRICLKKIRSISKAYRSHLESVPDLEDYPQKIQESELIKRNPAFMEFRNIQYVDEAPNMVYISNLDYEIGLSDIFISKYQGSQGCNQDIVQEIAFANRKFGPVDAFGYLCEAPLYGEEVYASDYGEEWGRIVSNIGIGVKHIQKKYLNDQDNVEVFGKVKTSVMSINNVYESQLSWNLSWAVDPDTKEAVLCRVKSIGVEISWLQLQKEYGEEAFLDVNLDFFKEGKYRFNYKKVLEGPIGDKVILEINTDFSLDFGADCLLILKCSSKRPMMITARSFLYADGPIPPEFYDEMEEVVSFKPIAEYYRYVGSLLLQGRLPCVKFKKLNFFGWCFHLPRWMRKILEIELAPQDLDRIKGPKFLWSSYSIEDSGIYYRMKILGLLLLSLNDEVDDIVINRKSIYWSLGSTHVKIKDVVVQCLNAHKLKFVDIEIREILAKEMTRLVNCMLYPEVIYGTSFPCPQLPYDEAVKAIDQCFARMCVEANRRDIRDNG